LYFTIIVVLAISTIITDDITYMHTSDWLLEDENSIKTPHSTI